MTFALIANNQIAGASGGTTAAANTTGAKLITLHSWGVSMNTPTDSLGNTWTGLTTQTNTAIGRIYYCINPTVGSAQTFSSTNGIGGLQMLAFSETGTPTFDVQNGATPGTTSGQTGSVSPSVNDSVIVTGATGPGGSFYADTINSGFTISNGISFTGGSNWGGSAAYLIQTTKGAVNPTWDGHDGVMALTIAVFNPGSAPGGGGGPIIRGGQIMHGAIIRGGRIAA